MGSFEQETRVSRVAESGRTCTAMRVIGYLKVSTAEQADSRGGIEAQRTAIEAEADRRGWELVCVYEDAGLSGKSMS